MNTIHGTIDRFEENFAIIKTTSNQNILWPRNNLDSHLKEGDAVALALLPDHIATKEKESLAKEIINQILQNSH